MTKKLTAKELKARTEGTQTRDYPKLDSPKLLDLSPEECKVMCKDAGVEYKVGHEKRVIRYTCSDPSVDRAGDVIKQDGWAVDNFRKNPVIMAFHDYSDFPVGSSIKTEVVEDKLKMDVMFATKDMNPKADMAFKMAKAGIMKAGSVGFAPTKFHIPDDDERKELGMNEQGGIIFDKQELLEFSVCGVPANANALTESISKGLFSKKDFELVYGEEVLKELEVEEKITGRTGTNQGHDHAFRVDEDSFDGTARGNNTNDASAASHTITNGVVQSAGDPSHTHSLPSEARRAEEGEKVTSFNKKEFKELVEQTIKQTMDTIPKAGAVLSSKNKSLINTAIEGMTNAAEALKTLMETVEPEKESEENKDIDTPNEKKTIDIDLNDVPFASDDEGLYDDENIINLKLN